MGIKRSELAWNGYLILNPQWRFKKIMSNSKYFCLEQVFWIPHYSARCQFWSFEIWKVMKSSESSPGRKPGPAVLDTYHLPHWCSENPPQHLGSEPCPFSALWRIGSVPILSACFFSNMLKKEKEKETNRNGYGCLGLQHLKFISCLFLVSACHLK